MATTPDCPAELQAFCLSRVARFGELALTADAGHNSQWRQLSRRALASAYNDCVELGCAAEADHILRKIGRAKRVKS